MTDERARIVKLLREERGSVGFVAGRLERPARREHGPD
jgi:hypothetical protein